MDLIERQKAIDALADMHCKSDENGYVWIIRSDAWARIDALPSAQPEKRTNKRTETHACDCISRQAAIDAITNYAKFLWEKFHETGNLAGMIEAIEGVPSAQPDVPDRKVGEWTPVSERLPKEDTDVLISYRYKDGEGDASHVYIDITSYGDMYFGGRKVKGAKHWRQPFEYFTSNYDIIAWMPLPKPWKGEEDK